MAKVAPRLEVFGGERSPDDARVLAADDGEDGARAMVMMVFGLLMHEAADRLGVHHMMLYRRTAPDAAARNRRTWRVDPADLHRGGRVRCRQGTSADVASDKRRRARFPPADACGPDALGLFELAMASGVEPAGRCHVEILARPAWGFVRLDSSVIPSNEHTSSGVAAKIVGRRSRSSAGTSGAWLLVGECHGLGVVMRGHIVQAEDDVLTLGAIRRPRGVTIGSRDDPPRDRDQRGGHATNPPAGPTHRRRARRRPPGRLALRWSSRSRISRPPVQADRSGHVGGGPARWR